MTTDELREVLTKRFEENASEDFDPLEEARGVVSAASEMMREILAERRES